uniref:L-serine dehydratase/L-threonine deaminase-like n=1 Tax=Styela clava TaxID=7725 RepID=UPI00193A8EB5|nr:L-serine dehydratase/L-threonine deaminase-like [Styela clava]
MMLHIKSPYKKSSSLSNCCGLNVYIKLDNVQPSGSFKMRGIGHLCSKFAEKGASKFVCSSGGNAGLAAAYAARELGKPCQIFTPESTPKFIVQNLRDYGAEVIVEGEAWDESNTRAKKEAEKPGCVYVSPFDHPDIWEGNSTIIDEIKEDVDRCSSLPKPDLIICVCGGGGLLCGIVHGLKKHNWNDIPVLVVETEGASSLYQSVKADKLVTLPAITSIAKTLGAKTVGKRTFEVTKTHKVVSHIVSDADAVKAIALFLDDERILVEPSCAAALAAVYNGTLKKLIESGELPSNIKNVAIEICGGSGIKLDMLEKWKKEFSV